MLTADLEVKHFLELPDTKAWILKYVDNPLTSIVSNFSLFVEDKCESATELTGFNQ